MKKEMKEKMKIRELKLEDLENSSFFETMSNLVPVEKMSYFLSKKIFNDCKKRGIKIYVMEHDGLIIGTIRCLLETKFYHDGKMVMHIEDVATHKEYEGLGVAKSLIKHAKEVSKQKNCYKVVLNCFEKLVVYYNKSDFKEVGVHMRFDN